MPIEKIERVIAFVKETAERFGARPSSYVFRNNAKNGPDDATRAYFGFVEPDETPSGTYHDFSLVLFPGGIAQKWIVEVGVGSSGFKNDFDLSTYPGLRRLFANLVDMDNGFCKSDFSDIETRVPRSFTNRPDLQHLSNTISYYSPFFSACQVIDDPENDEGKAVIASFIAAYAKIRHWPSNQGHRTAVENALRARVPSETLDSIDEVKALLNDRRFVILQGAPGTGKTRAAKIVAESLHGKIFFTQFHAETSYSDFVHGIIPDTSNVELRYQNSDGILANSIRHSLENPTENTVLIIDEINRANLSNVLGPIFYLFEHKMDESDIEIQISPGLLISRLPQNFFVIATMNTADRSLAVVDFALRRRFAWYTMKPVTIRGSRSGFFNDDFASFDEIFQWYATSDELALQPGQGYFFASNEAEMKNRVTYELYPLIREYLQEGLLRPAKEEFNSYFLKRINRSLFE